MEYAGPRKSSRMARFSSAWKAVLMLVLLACVALDAARAAAPVLAGRMPVSRTNLTGPPPRCLPIPSRPPQPTHAATDAHRRCARALGPNRSTLDPAPGRRSVQG